MPLPESVPPTQRQRIWNVFVDGTTVEYDKDEMAVVCRNFARRKPFFVVQGIDNLDISGRFVARLYFWEPRRPYEQTNFVLVAGNLPDLRAQTPPGMWRAPRLDGDHQRILEVWL